MVTLNEARFYNLNNMVICERIDLKLIRKNIEELCEERL